MEEAYCHGDTRPEIFTSRSANLSSCVKNPSHDTTILWRNRVAVASSPLEEDLIKLYSKLTVKIVVNHQNSGTGLWIVDHTNLTSYYKMELSSERGDDSFSSSLPSFSQEDDRRHIVDDVKRAANTATIPKDTSTPPSSPIVTTAAMMMQPQSDNNRKSGRLTPSILLVEVHRDLITSDQQAIRTKVQDRNKGIIAVGLRVYHAPDKWNQCSILVCRAIVDDYPIEEEARAIWQEISSLTHQMPSPSVNRTYVLSYIHESDNLVLTYGSDVSLKFKLVNPEMMILQKVSGNSKEPHLLEMLLYTAATCPGSAGGVVLQFIKSTQKPFFNRWMHNGVHPPIDLNSSTLRFATTCITDDSGPPRVIKVHANQNPETMSNPEGGEEIDTNSSSSTQTTTEIPAPLPPPTAAAVVSQTPIIPPQQLPQPFCYVHAHYQQRLRSFPPNFSHIHLPERLASSGFFYAGFADCVRCFQCGLGLKSWKPGDDIETEHFRNRADCPFLLLKLQELGIDRVALQTTVRQTRALTSWRDRQPPSSSLETRDSQLENPEILSIVRNRQLPPPDTVDDRQQQPSTPPDTVDKELDQPELLPFLPSPPLTPPLASSPPLSSSSNNEILAASSNRISSGGYLTRVLKREHDILKERLTCIMCKAAPVQELLLPCGHLTCCNECGANLKNCNICGKFIIATANIYLC